MKKILLITLIITNMSLVFGYSINNKISSGNSVILKGINSDLEINPIISMSSSFGVERKDVITPVGFDGTTLVYSLSNNPSFLSVKKLVDYKGVLVKESFLLIISKTAPVGTYTDIVLSVNDDTSSDTETFTIIIKPATSGIQKMNIDPVSSSRFSIPQNLVWPTNVGEADVCLWKDDRLAAATITIDDNHEGDHSWWLEMQEKYNINLTWFLIIDNVSAWNKYQDLIDAGNEVQSHDLAIDYTHGAINDSTDATYIKTITEVGDTINKMLTDNSSITLAYPYGLPKGYVSRDRYIAMRGVTGLMNYANKINYLDMNSRSATNDPHDVEILLDPTQKLYNNVYYRGLASYHYHGVARFGPARSNVETFLSALHERSDSIWTGMFSEVARYGQERDTHSLTVDNIAAEEIRFTLTDEMNDTYFDYPLTVKIRVENAWEGVKAVQDGKEIDAKIVTKDGSNYALINAVPDKGQVTISKSEALSNIDFEKKSFKVYPNPVSGSVINIQLLVSSYDIQNIELISITGKIVYSSVINNGETTHEINLDNQLKQGIYFVRVSDKNSVSTKKIILK